MKSFFCWFLFVASCAHGVSIFWPFTHESSVVVAARSLFCNGFNGVSVVVTPEHVGAEPDAFLFAGPDGGALRARQWRARHWAPAAAEAALAPLRPHDLRHTAVALWIAQGASPKQIATWAGHTSVSVVLDRYGHLFPGHEQTVMELLEAGYTTPSAPPKGELRRLPGVASTTSE